MDNITLALIAGSGIVFSLFKLFGYRKVLRFEFLIDFLATACLPWLFFGTFSGMTLAVLTGIVISVELLLIRNILKFTIGYEKPNTPKDIANWTKERAAAYRNYLDGGAPGAGAVGSGHR